MPHVRHASWVAASKNLTPEQRKLRARIAAHAQWANTENRRARMAAARQGSLAKFEQQADPDGVLDDQERARRAESLQAAHMRSLALRSAKARKRT